MFREIRDRYGPYRRRREKKEAKTKGKGPFERRYQWLHWKILEEGGFSFRVPCLDHP
jgi:hypothetical protein